jgi:hydrogenase expression/formation protein HypD
MLERINKAYGFIDKACKKLGGTVNIMEVSGAHTVATFRCGMRSAFPPELGLLPGPGCSSCIVDQNYIDSIIDISQRQDCIIALYDNMTGPLLSKAEMANVKIITLAEETIALAKENPSKTIVFATAGFQTAASETAMVVKEAVEQRIENFCLLYTHRLIVPAIKAILSEKNNKIDAFLCSGPESVVIGSEAYKPIIEQFARPCVIAGFEPMQIIEAVGEICRQISEQKIEPDRIFAEGINPKGDETALRIISDYFDVTDGLWRGIGKVSASSLKLKAHYNQFDAISRFGLKEKESQLTKDCQCDQILCGLITPPQCDMFASDCTPETPIGPCMAETESPCAAWYKYTQSKRTNS